MPETRGGKEERDHGQTERCRRHSRGLGRTRPTGRRGRPAPLPGRAPRAGAIRVLARGLVALPTPGELAPFAAGCAWRGRPGRSSSSTRPSGAELARRAASRGDDAPAGHRPPIDVSAQGDMNEGKDQRNGRAALPRDPPFAPGTDRAVPTGIAFPDRPPRNRVVGRPAPETRPRSFAVTQTAGRRPVAHRRRR